MGYRALCRRWPVTFVRGRLNCRLLVKGAAPLYGMAATAGRWYAQPCQRFRWRGDVFSNAGKGTAE